MVTQTLEEETPAASPEATPQSAPPSFVAGLWAALNQPIDIASLVFFRIFFGIVAFWHTWIQMPGVKAQFIDPDFHFTYYGFGWVKPLPGEDLMHVVFIAMAASAVLIALGLYYRAAAIAFFVLHTYTLLIEQAGYWNHYYLITLIGFLMIFIPANRAFSLDVLRGRVQQSDDAPSWALWALRAQMGITYFYAGLAKVSDDWLHGLPMDNYLFGHQNFPFLGRWFTEEWMVYFFSYGGMLLDLLIVPLLLWRVTRLPALALAIAFHLSNPLMFDIEVFPYLAIAATLLFLPPEWPRFGGQWRRLRERGEEAVVRASPRLSWVQTAVVAVFAVYFAIQLLLPLRHVLYPGNVEWTTEGYHFSWRMLLGDKDGSVRFFLTSKNAEGTCEIDLREYLAGFQASKLAQRPDMMVQFAHYIHDLFEKRGADVEVHAYSSLSLNGRTHRALVDPEVDLASVDRTMGHYAFLYDLETAQPVGTPNGSKCFDPRPRPPRLIPEPTRPPSTPNF